MSLAKTGKEEDSSVLQEMEVWDCKCDSLLLVLLGVSEECATGPFAFFFFP